MQGRIAAGGPITIMPLGDSITRGTGVLGGYRTELYNKLTKAGSHFTFVGSTADNASATLTSAGQIHHEGHGSIRINQIEANLDANTHYQDGIGYWLAGTNDRPAVYPDVILLMAGITASP